MHLCKNTWALTKDSRENGLELHLGPFRELLIGVICPLCGDLEARPSASRVSKGGVHAFSKFLRF